MIVRVTIFATRSVDESLDWVRPRIDDLRAVDGVERFEVVSKEEPPRAGAIIYFSSREAWERYRDERLPVLKEEIFNAWGEGHPVEEVFQVEDM